jgi:hypothetical protein
MAAAAVNVAIMARSVTIMGDDETHQRREIPPFPWNDLRHIFELGGDYSSDTTAKQIPMAAHRMFDGIRWASLERARFGPVILSVQRAFNESRKRHGLGPAHWNILMACEVGFVERPDQKGILRWCIYRPERQDHLMPYEEAARVFDLSDPARYHREVCKAIEDEWAWLHSGFEQ